MAGLEVRGAAAGDQVGRYGSRARRRHDLPKAATGRTSRSRGRRSLGRCCPRRTPDGSARRCRSRTTTATAIHLDSSFLIHALRPGSAQERRLLGWLNESSELGVSDFAWAEFLCGPVSSEGLVGDAGAGGGRFDPAGPFEASRSDRTKTAPQAPIPRRGRALRPRRHRHTSTEVRSSGSRSRTAGASRPSTAARYRSGDNAEASRTSTAVWRLEWVSSC
jgi:hypothetical protein